MLKTLPLSSTLAIQPRIDAGRSPAHGTLRTAQGARCSWYLGLTALNSNGSEFHPSWTPRPPQLFFDVAVSGRHAKTPGRSEARSPADAVTRPRGPPVRPVVLNNPSRLILLVAGRMAKVELRPDQTPVPQRGLAGPLYADEISDNMRSTAALATMRRAPSLRLGIVPSRISFQACLG